MKSKNILPLLMSAAGALLITACKKDFLTITPPNQVSSTSVNTLPGLQAILNNSFEQMVDAGAVDVLQADATRCGGISVFLKAGNTCEAQQLPFSSHCAP